VLVFLVMYLFLQNFRATLIPPSPCRWCCWAPSACCRRSAFDQHADHVRHGAGHRPAGGRCHRGGGKRRAGDDEEGLSPKEATRKSMGQITGALVGIALVLSAVFVPMAFFGGSTGVIYRQFSITIVSAMVLSVLVAMVLTPALCATCSSRWRKATRSNTGFFGWFNRSFERAAALIRLGSVRS
jgi:multidrug efflux pump